MTALTSRLRRTHTLNLPLRAAFNNDTLQPWYRHCLGLKVSEHILTPASADLRTCPSCRGTPCHPKLNVSLAYNVIFFFCLAHTSYGRKAPSWPLHNSLATFVRFPHNFPLNLPCRISSCLFLHQLKSGPPCSHHSLPACISWNHSSPHQLQLQQANSRHPHSGQGQSTRTARLVLLPSPSRC